MKLSIVIPCYNEALNIPKLFNKISPIAKNNSDIEIILVNNGSKDNSEEIFNEQLHALQLPNLKVVNVSVNEGYGWGILSGLQAANGHVLSWTHADLQTDPADVLKAYHLFKDEKINEHILIKGIRKNRSISETFFTFGMGIYASIVLRKWLFDINAQPKLFSRNFYEKIVHDAPKDFSLDLYFLFKAKQMGKIITFPVVFPPRVAGESKGGSGSSWAVKKKLIKRSLAYIVELRKYLKQ